jgi:osmotically-inducible protein OsmY
MLTPICVNRVATLAGVCVGLPQTTMNFKSKLALLLVATVTSNCAIKTASDTAAPEPRAPARPQQKSTTVAEETPSDESIGAEIRRRLVVLGPGETAGVVIEVDDGVVTLRGVAPSQAAGWRAQSAALSVKGVKLVRNQIIVNTPGTLP